MKETARLCARETDWNFLITCPYCASENSGDEHRCQRCGRRLEPATTTKVYFSRDATAPALAPVAAVEAPPREAEAAARLRLVGNGQRALFPLQPEPPSGENKAGLQEASREQAKVPARSRKARAVAAERRQQQFEFPVAAPPQRKVSSSRYIDCDAVSAGILARLGGLALDLGVIVAGFGLFAAAQKLWLGFLPGGRPAQLAWGVAALLIAALFKTLWALGNGDSPGQYWMGLRLISFDGRRPSRSQRIGRVLAGVFISFAGACLGLLWAFFDEELLTFHDLISRAFPTER